MWKGYTNIYERLGMQHHAVNHGHGFSAWEYDKITNDIKVYHTNGIEATWHVLKDAIPVRNRKKEDLPFHLSEFIWRRQIKESGTDLWEVLIECMRDSNTLLDEETIEENVTEDL